MKPLTLIVVLFAFLIVPPVLARLGETPDQCALRYGERYVETAGQGFWAAERKYEKSGIRVTIRYLRTKEGGLKAEYIEYRPINLSTNRLTETKIRSLLETVSSDWTRLVPVEPPPLSVKPPPDPSRTLTSGKTSKLTTIEAAGGYEKKQADKKARERKALLDSIDARNKDISDLKMKIGKIASHNEVAWASSCAYATGSESALTIFSADYMDTFDHQAELERARKAKADRTPLTGL